MKYKKILIIRTGSFVYKTNFENSDHDMIEIFAKGWDDMLDETQDISKKGDTTIYEIGAFIKELIKGELQCHQVLWTSPEYIKLNTDIFDVVRKYRGSFINKRVLEYWKACAEYNFGRSRRIATLKADSKTVLDFLTFAHEGHTGSTVRTMSTIVKEGKLDSSGCMRSIPLKDLAAFDIGFNTDTYEIWEFYGNTNGEKTAGLIDLDDELIVMPRPEPRPSNAFYKGILTYDRTAHKKYKKLKSLVAANKKVARGYSASSMYHAFRTLSCITHFTKYGLVPVEVPNKMFLMDIRRHNYDYDTLKTKFAEMIEEVNKRLSDYNNTSEIDMKIVKNIVQTIRNKVAMNVEEVCPV